MPPLPEFLDVAGEERAVEVITYAYTHEIACADRHEGIAGEIEEEVERVGVHIDHGIGEKTFTAAVHDVCIDEKGHGKFVEHAYHNFLYAGYEVLSRVFGRGDTSRGLVEKSAVARYRT